MYKVDKKSYAIIVLVLALSTAYLIAFNCINQDEYEYLKRTNEDLLQENKELRIQIENMVLERTKEANINGK